MNEAARIMWEHDCGCVPVVDEGRRVIGMLTDRDACMAAYTQGLRLQDLPVHRAMSNGATACRWWTRRTSLSASSPSPT